MLGIEALSDGARASFLAFVGNLFRFFESDRIQWLRRHLNREHWIGVEHQAGYIAKQPGIQDHCVNAVIGTAKSFKCGSLH